MAFSRAMTSSGTSSRVTQIGADAATCMARSWVNSLNGSLRETKSVSTPTSTSTPILPPAWMYESTAPSLVARALFFCARGQALLAQLVHRLLEVAVRRGQRLLAVHHACPALLAELLYQCSGDLSHSTILS